jgi:hypothetical protein
MKLMWSDSRTRVVVRFQRTAVLAVIEFAVFQALQRRHRKKVTSRDLWDEVYRGVANPPANPGAVIRSAACKMNRKLARLHLEVRLHNHRAKSFYQLVDTGAPPKCSPSD